MFVESDMDGLFKSAQHEEIIMRFASNGWRFVTALVSQQGVDGRIHQYKLVFEKKAKEKTI